MFKKLVVAAFVFFIAIAAKADEGQKVTSKVQKVVVFLKGAQVTRTAMVNVSAGTTDLVFGGVSPGIDEQSIQVHAAGEFTILSVKQEMNYFTTSEDVKVKQIDQLEVQQKIIRDKIAMQTSMLSIYQTEENILSKNQFVKPENQFLDVIKLKQALDFQTERLTALKGKEQAAANLILELTSEIQKYDNQINEINQDKSISTTNIIVTVSSKMALQASFTISYLVGNASWYPSYDIRAKNTSSPLTIIYKANVSQKSGEEWKNVKLTLSTGSPSGNSLRPELNPYYLSFYDIQHALQGRASGVNVQGYSSSDKQLAEVVVSSAPTIRMVENQINVEFNIDNTWSVANDGKPSQVEINRVNTAATYQYYVAPKLSTDVFLTAQVTDLNKYNFLSGSANLFFEDTYIGKSQIDTRTISDTLNLSLGTDKSILVKRTLQTELTQNQTFGSNKKETKSWLIEVKNRKNQKVNLLVEDQVPVSQNSSIEVEVLESAGVKPDPLTGKVSWNFLLNSQEDKKTQLKYMVKYPKSQQVIVQ